jgi:hypothetical protein
MKNKWDKKHIQQLKQSGYIKGYVDTERNKNKPITDQISWNKLTEKRSKEKDWLNWNLSYWANEQALEMVTEYMFDDKRKWRMDWAFPALKIAVEYEGIFSKKSRHTTVKGYTGDVEKYNAAVKNGWRLLRVTAVDYKSIIQQLNHLVYASNSGDGN